MVTDEQAILDYYARGKSVAERRSAVFSMDQALEEIYSRLRPDADMDRRRYHLLHVYWAQHVCFPHCDVEHGDRLRRRAPSHPRAWPSQLVSPPQ